MLSTGNRIHRSAIFADYDDDGRIDVFVTVNGQQVEDGQGNNIFDPNQGKGILFHNETESDNNWIKVRLEGTKSNRDGFGATVSIKAGKIKHKQALVSGQGYFSTHAKEIYFGLGSVKSIDKIEVSWPSGMDQAFENIPANQTVYILEGETLHQNTSHLIVK